MTQDVTLFKKPIWFALRGSQLNRVLEGEIIPLCSPAAGAYLSERSCLVRLAKLKLFSVMGDAAPAGTYTSGNTNGKEP